MRPTRPVTHGTPGRRLRLADFVVTEARYAAGAAVPRHEHEHPSWTLVLAGAVEETFTSGTYTCCPGAVLSKPAAATHSNRYGPAGAHCLVVEVQPGRLTDARRGRERLFARVRHHAVGPVPALGRRLRAEFSLLCRKPDDAARADDAVRFSIEGLLFEIAAAELRLDGPPPSPHAHRPRWLREAREWLDAGFRSPVRVTALAETLDIHPVYLSSAFRATYGCTPGEYVRRLRVEWAREALARTDRPIADIALAAGFSDQSHLTRHFRRATGVTPARYRAAARRSG